MEAVGQKRGHLTQHLSAAVRQARQTPRALLRRGAGKGGVAGPSPKAPAMPLSQCRQRQNNANECNRRRWQLVFGTERRTRSGVSPRSYSPHQDQCSAYKQKQNKGKKKCFNSVSHNVLPSHLIALQISLNSISQQNTGYKIFTTAIPALARKNKKKQTSELSILLLSSSARNRRVIVISLFFFCLLSFPVCEIRLCYSPHKKGGGATRFIMARFSCFFLSFCLFFFTFTKYEIL